MIIEVMNLPVFYQWEDGNFGIRQFKLEVIESGIKEQCKKCFFNLNRFHCPSVPCGAIARKDGKYVYFKETK